MPDSHTSPRPDEWNPHQRLLTIEEAARSVGRPASTIRRWLTEGLTVFARLGHRPLILEADLLAFESGRMSPPHGTMKNPRTAGTAGG
jgi:excisionase family DNA binding protein